VFCATITIKYGVLCKNKTWLWFCAKHAPTYGVMCNFLDQIEPNICPIQLDQCSTTWKYNQMFQVLINHICKCWLETPSPLNLSRGRGFMLTQIRKLSSFSPDTDGSASNSCRQKKERTRRIPRYLVRTIPHIHISLQHHIWYSIRQKKGCLNL
jgi:hypothetical protein